MAIEAGDLTVDGETAYPTPTRTGERGESQQLHEVTGGETHQNPVTHSPERKGE
jgi:hypothetical protein